MRGWPRRVLRKGGPLVLMLLLLTVLVYGTGQLSRDRHEGVRYLSSNCEPFPGRCRGKDATSAIEVSLPAKEIKALKAFPVRVRLKGIQARRVTVEFQGVDMYMGFNRITLKKQAEGVFGGSAELVACITGRMLWEADVRVYGSEGPVKGLLFRFWAS